MNKLLKHLRQPSTIKSLMIVLGLVGVQLSPAQADAIVTLVGLAYVLYEGLRDEDEQIKKIASD